MSNGTKICFQFCPCHTKTSIGNGQGMIILIEINGDFKGHMGIKNIVFGQTLMTHLLQCICTVGNEFTNKNITLGVKRINYNIQQLLRFCLKFMGTCLVGHSFILLLGAESPLYIRNRRFHANSIAFFHKVGQNDKHACRAVKPLTAAEQHKS